MNLNWQSHPQQANKRTAVSASHQYVLIVGSDGTTGLTVQHRGDRPSARPVKHFTYKNRKAAENGAQRFEDRHGYEDPAHFAPVAVVPFLPELPEPITDVLHSNQMNVQAVRRLVAEEDSGISKDDVEEIYAQYRELCASVLCCSIFDCYNRTEPGAISCDEHQSPDDTKE